MRLAPCLTLLLALGCGGKPGPAQVVETCDNNRDDDGDGKVDCADEDCFGRCDTGLTSTTTTGSATGSTTVPTFTGTTGVTNPGSPLTMVADPTINQFQHEVGLTQCPQNIGRILVENTSAEQAQLIVWSERYQEQIDLFSFQLDGNPIEYWVDFPIPAGQASVVTVYYACTADSSFLHFINAEFRHGSDDTQDNGAVWQSQGVIQ